MRHQLIRKTTAIVLAGLMLTSTAYGASAIQTVDPQSPYDPPVSGLFHDQSLDGDNAGEYTVYISPDFEPCSGAVLLLTPDDTTAEGFFASDIGQAWKTVIDRDGLALVVAEPENAGAWNTGDSPDARDDEAFLKALWDRMRSKSQELEAPFDMDERAVYLVGYEEGGAAAQEFAMEWPTLFAGVASVNASEIPEDVMQAAGEAYSYPFAQAENLDGGRKFSCETGTYLCRYGLLGQRLPTAMHRLWSPIGWMQMMRRRQRQTGMRRRFTKTGRLAFG